VFGAARRAAGLPEARLHAFRGALSFGGGDEPSFVADVTFRSSEGVSEDAWIAGELRIERASWTDAPGGASARAMHGSATLFVSSSSFRLVDGILEGERARVRFSAHGAVDAPSGRRTVDAATLVIDSARTGPFLDAASAILGRALPVPPGVPRDAGLTGDISFDADAGARAEPRRRP